MCYDWDMSLFLHLSMLEPSVAELLRVRFEESDLEYHNYDHIENMILLLFNYFGGGLSQRELMIMLYAIWFHDYVYDPRASDNEERSAEAARAALSPFLDPADVNLICEIIIASKGHRTSNPFIQKFLDLDLAILGSPLPTYQRYARAIREEYSFYPEADYRAGRVEKVLKPFLEEPLLRWLSIARRLPEDALERQAHANMRWEIERLQDTSKPLAEALSS